MVIRTEIWWENSGDGVFWTEEIWRAAAERLNWAEWSSSAIITISNAAFLNHKMPIFSCHRKKLTASFSQQGRLFIDLTLSHSHTHTHTHTHIYTDCRYLIKKSTTSNHINAPQQECGKVKITMCVRVHVCVLYVTDSEAVWYTFICSCSV